MAFDFFKNLFGKKPLDIQTTSSTATETKDAPSVSDPTGSIFGPRWFSDTGIPVTPWSSLQSAAVYACIKVLSEDVAKLPLRVRRKLTNGGWVDASDHPVNKLLHRPNGYQTPYDFWSYLVVSQQLRGNGYAAIVRNGAGDPVKLIPLIYDRVTCLMTERGDIYYQATAPQLGYSTVILHPEDIIHIKNMSLDGGIMGSSVISAAQNVVGLGLSTQKHAATLFRQSAMPRGAIQMPPGATLSKESADKLGAAFAEAYAGSDNAHTTMVLEGGMEFKAISMSAEDAQLLEARKFSGEEIARLFRVPLHKINILDHATFSNIENLEQSYINDTLMTICRRAEEAMEATLLFENERDKYRIRFDFDELLRGDTKTRYEAYQIGLLNGVLSRNEVREKEGLPPVEGGDEYRVPLNTGPVSAVVPAPTDSTPEAVVPGKPETPSDT